LATLWSRTSPASALRPAGLVAMAVESGMTVSMTMAKMTNVSCQPTAPIRPTESGAKMNCPAEPAAVPKPKAIERFSGGKSLPNAARTMLNEHPARPKPTSTPAVKSKAIGLVEIAMRARPAA
jgi:hypothetical protein